MSRDIVRQESGKRYALKKAQEGLAELEADQPKNFTAGRSEIYHYHNARAMYLLTIATLQNGL